MDRVNDALIQAFAVAPRGTAARIARELDVAPQTVSKWASGSILPEQHRWPDLERLLGLDDGALMAAHRAAAEIKRPDDHIPPAVSEAIGRLGDELRNLRGEVSALRSEVDELRGERHGSARSSDRSRRAAGTTSDREGP